MIFFDPADCVFTNGFLCREKIFVQFFSVFMN